MTQPCFLYMILISLSSNNSIFYVQFANACGAGVVKSFITVITGVINSVILSVYFYNAVMSRSF